MRAKTTHICKAVLSQLPSGILLGLLSYYAIVSDAPWFVFLAILAGTLFAGVLFRVLSVDDPFPFGSLYSLFCLFNRRLFNANSTYAYFTTAAIMAIVTLLAIALVLLVHFRINHDSSLFANPHIIFRILTPLLFSLAFVQLGTRNLNSVRNMRENHLSFNNLSANYGMWRDYGNAATDDFQRLLITKYPNDIDSVQRQKRIAKRLFRARMKEYHGLQKELSRLHRLGGAQRTREHARLERLNESCHASFKPLKDSAVRYAKRCLRLRRFNELDSIYRRLKNQQLLSERILYLYCRGLYDQGSIARARSILEKSLVDLYFTKKKCNPYLLSLFGQCIFHQGQENERSAALSILQHVTQHEGKNCTYARAIYAMAIAVDCKYYDENAEHSTAYYTNATRLQQAFLINESAKTLFRQGKWLGCSDGHPINPLMDVSWRAMYHDTRGYIYLKLNQLDNAIQEFRGNTKRPLFRLEDFRDIDGFTNKIMQRNGPISEYIFGRIVSNRPHLLTSLHGNPNRLRHHYVRHLNVLISEDRLWEKEAFTGVVWREEATRLSRDCPDKQAQIRLNRIILEDCFPAEIERSNVSEEYTLSLFHLGKAYIRKGDYILAVRALLRASFLERDAPKGVISAKVDKALRDLKLRILLANAEQAEGPICLLKHIVGFYLPYLRSFFRGLIRCSFGNTTPRFRATPEAKTPGRRSS